jgi:2-methylcitrate dehydratase PrpD
VSVGLTREIGVFIENLAFGELPPDAVATTAIGFTDCIACGLAGSTEPAARIVRDGLSTKGPRGEATLLNDPNRAAAPDAALVNGVACHVLDYDDVALYGHTSAVLVPAILAEGEALGATGQDAVCAYVAGYETWSDLISRDRDLHHEKGWHPTGVFGTVAAAAAAAKLHRLHAARASHAVGLAASLAAGLIANFGSTAKALVAGRAAQNGILAARMAAAGMTAAGDVMEHPLGFLHAISPHGAVDTKRAPAFGRDWGILHHGLGLKRHPVCIYCLRSVDAVFALTIDPDLPPQEIRRIRVVLGPTEAGILKYHRPQTGLEARFSIEFALSAALIAGRLGLAELTDEFVRRAEVQDLIQRVHVDICTDIDPDVPIQSRFAQVTIEMTNGAIIESRPVYEARGSAGQPLSRDDLWEKFQDCSTGTTAEPQARSLFERLQSLDQVTSISAILRGDAPP